MNHAGKAGTEKYVESLIKGLNNKEVKAYLAFCEEGLLVENLREMGIETFRIVMRHPFDLKAAWALSLLCKKLGIDIIHTQYLRENYIAAWSRLFNPKVKVFYTNHFILRNNLVLRIFNRIVTLMESNIIAVCTRGKEMMILNGLDRKKIKIIFNAVDPYYWAEPPESDFRHELGIDENVYIILCASRFAHDKGHKFLVNAIADLKKITEGEFLCVLANDGPFLEQVKLQVKELKLEEEVIFIGFRKDIKNLYYGADLYINSSEHEALSFAILEVLGSGLPIIATDMGGNSDIINEETNCGILVKYDDAKSLAEAIDKVMSDLDLQVTLRKNALNTIRDKFNLVNMITETYNLYKDSYNQ